MERLPQKGGYSEFRCSHVKGLGNGGVGKKKQEFKRRGRRAETLKYYEKEDVRLQRGTRSKKEKGRKRKRRKEG